MHHLALKKAANALRGHGDHDHGGEMGRGGGGVAGSEDSDASLMQPIVP